MDLTPYIDAVREDLNTAASAGDEQTRRTAATLSAALEPAARLALMNALSDLAAEVTASLESHVVDVRLDGRELRVVITDTAAGTETPPQSSAESASSSTTQDDSGGDISRITLRMLEQIKGQAEQAAATQGVSLNTFVSQAVQGALAGAGRRRHRPPHSHPGFGGSNLHGWVQG